MKNGYKHDIEGLTHDEADIKGMFAHTKRRMPTRHKFIPKGNSHWNDGKCNSRQVLEDVRLVITLGVKILSRLAS